MTNKQLEKDILKAKKRRPSFFGAALAVFSILYGQFIIQVETKKNGYKSYHTRGLSGII